MNEKEVIDKLCRIDLTKTEQLFADLKDFVRRLKDIYRITRVYLFGSFARGDFDEGSDIDLLIIGDFKGRLVERIKTVMDMTDLPIEPLVYTDEEFETMRHSNPFIKEILKEGKEL